MVKINHTPVVKINRPVYGLFAIFLFAMSSFVDWHSLSSYVDFFQSNDSVEFSFGLGIFIFGSPILFYFSYLSIIVAVTGKPVKVNDTISKIVSILFIFGMVFSFVFSPYLSYSLLSQGYIICPNKISWQSPNKYVRDISLCYRKE